MAWSSIKMLEIILFHLMHAVNEKMVKAEDNNAGIPVMQKDCIQVKIKTKSK